MRYLTFGLAVCVIGSLIGCGLRANKNAATNQQPPLDEVTLLKPTPAALTEGTQPVVNAIETKITGKPESQFVFRQAQFVNEYNGWVMSLGSLYRTSDGGKTWQRLSKEAIGEDRFVSFSFVDKSHGWLAIFRKDVAKSYLSGNSSDIMVTDDGGKSWQLQASFQDEVEILDIRFLNQSEGLAVGYKRLANQPQYAELFVLGTANGGKYWKNISGPAKATFKNQWGIANDSGRFIQWTSSSILLLTDGGRVMSTTDGGKTWKTIAIFKGEGSNGFYETSYQKIVLDPKGKVSLLGGANGDGYWGDFVVLEEGRWTSYELSLTPTEDAVFISEKEVIASGMNCRPWDEKKNSRLKDAGVILRSFDRGKTWQTVYRSKSSETFFYLTRVKDNNFYAVSDAGTFLRFTLPQ